MSDVIEQGPVPTIYADGFDDYQICNGSLRCTGYQLMPGDFPGCEPLKIAVVKLIVSPNGADAAQMETQRVLRQKSTPIALAAAARMKGH